MVIDWGCLQRSGVLWGDNGTTLGARHARVLLSARRISPERQATLKVSSHIVANT